MPRRPAGNNNARESAGGAVREHDLQLAENHIPVLAASVPVLYDALRGQVKHLAQGIVIGKGRLVLGDLSELAVQPFNDVCRVDDLPDLRRVFKEGAQDLPVLLPAFHAGRILFAPGLGENTQRFFRLFQRYRRVDLLQVCGDLLDVLVADIFGGAADLMDNAALKAS